MKQRTQALIGFAHPEQDKPSHASLLLRTINLPIFIAHR